MFSGRTLRVVGVDENGYGPLAGPLVVTRVVLEYEGDDPLEDLQLRYFPTLPIRDSKEVFQRNRASYARGEAVALWILGQAGLHPQNTLELWEMLAPAEAPLIRSSPYGANIALPVWQDRPLQAPRLSAFARVVDIRMRVLLPEHLRGKNKHQENLRVFLEHVDASGAQVALLGKLGGMIRYGPHLPAPCEVLEERREQSIYRVGEKTLAFIKNADSRFLPVAMASIVGKYVRELLMLAVNRALGHPEALPWASGYHHDPRTRTLVEEARKRGWDLTRP